MHHLAEIKQVIKLNLGINISETAKSQFFVVKLSGIQKDREKTFDYSKSVFSLVIVIGV